MHDVIFDGLEQYLSGNASAVFLHHLEECEECRLAVEPMMAAAAAIRELRLPEESEDPFYAPVEPRPGFYNRVAAQIVEQEQRRSWGIFSPGALFFRRIAFASLLMMAGLGSLLVTHESSSLDRGEDAVAIMSHQHADQVSVASDSHERGEMLVALADYGE